jgi:hypothetical protein
VKVSQQALRVARIEAGQGTPEEKARVMAWDRLHGMLSTLDSKVSVLLRFNAIVVAALAYVVVGGRLDRLADGGPDFDDAALQRLGDLVARRTLLYSRAWQFAVAGGTGFAVLVALATIH